MATMATATKCFLFLLLWVALGGCASSDSVCPNTGEQAPDVITFMASKTDPEMEAWIVQPNCDVEVVRVVRTPYNVFLDSYRTTGIERVASVPRTVASLSFTSHPLSRGANFTSGAALEILFLSDFSPKLVENLLLPRSAKRITIHSSNFSSLDGVKFPPSVQELYITNSMMTSIHNVVFPEQLQLLQLYLPRASMDGAQFPPRLTELSITSEAITSLKNVKFPPGLKRLSLYTQSELDLVFPKKLVYFSFQGSRIPVLELLQFPNSLRTIFIFCDTTVVRGIKWPSQLLDIKITSKPVTAFEIRQSDVKLFEKITRTFLSFSWSTDLTIDQSSCADPAATLTTINLNEQWRMRVISDERFASVYGWSEDSTTSSGASESSTGDPDEDTVDGSQKSLQASGSGSNLDDDDGTITLSGDDKATRKSATRTPSSNPSPSATSSSSSVQSPQDPAGTGPKASQRPSSTGADKQSGSSPNAPNAGGEETEVVQTWITSDKAMIAAVIVAGVVLGFATVSFILRIFVARSTRAREDKDIYSSLDTPHCSTTLFGEPQDKEAFGSLVFGTTEDDDDKLLLQFRLRHVDIVVKEEIARHGAGVVFHGVYKDRDVAVKRIQSAWISDERILVRFVDEIRMCARLAHPNITAFIGIAWEHQQDHCAVAELVSGGDLETLLYNQSEPPLACDWSTTWTPSQIKSKTAIAIDVAEALVYLHSLDKPISHRDLRARNVRLDGDSTAKLDTFAINCNTSVDETMRGGSTSVAWIAPEVLLGQAYTEKADVYAFGVLLVELERCRHPLSNESRTEDEVSSGDSTKKLISVNEITQTSIQIAVGVTAGELRPTVSKACPERVAALVARCLSYDATDRPSGRNVLDDLREIHSQQ